MRGALALAGRILLGLLRDKPTLGLVLGAPWLLFFLFGQVLDVVPPGRFNADFLKPVLLAVFLFFLTYLLTGIGFLRERQRGTLERLLTSRATRSGLVAGYFLGYGAMAVVQATMLQLAGVVFLNVDFPNGAGLFFLAEALGAATALGLGILISVLARTELQVIQSMPIVLSPQIILGGMLVPVALLPSWLEAIARALPLTYLLDAMAFLTLGQGSWADFWTDLGVLVAFTVASVLAGAWAIGRRR